MFWSAVCFEFSVPRAGPQCEPCCERGLRIAFQPRAAVRPEPRSEEVCARVIRRVFSCEMRVAFERRRAIGYARRRR
eukprot:11224477-Lingulodinium_polyedra.AAC.1